MKKFMLLLLSVFISFNAIASQELESFNSSYNSLLKEYVKNNQYKEGVNLSLVDYTKLKEDKNLLIASDLLKEVKVSTLSKEEQLSFWINAYNFYTLELVANNYPVESIKDLGSFFNSVWDKHKFEVEGREYTLNNIEHSVIRPLFKEPRIHFALVCASISCPDLLNEAYDAKILNQQLEAQTKNFLNNPTKGVMIKNNMVKVSKLFRWYKKDFYNGNTLAFVQHYKKIPYIHGYLDYNWNLNSIND